MPFFSRLIALTRIHEKERNYHCAYGNLKKDGRFELRKYKNYIAAIVHIAADSYNAASKKAFRLLADYIFGNNTKNTKVAMNAPFATFTLDSQAYVASFTVPSKYSMKALPRPNNSEVKELSSQLKEWASKIRLK